MAFRLFSFPRSGSLGMFLGRIPTHGCRQQCTCAAVVVALDPAGVGAHQHGDGVTELSGDVGRGDARHKGCGGEGVPGVVAAAPADAEPPECRAPVGVALAAFIVPRPACDGVLETRSR